MPTIPQLPVATDATATDIVPISQNGVLRAAAIATILDGTQSALTLASGSLLGRVSAGAGVPEPVAVGAGLEIVNGVLTTTSTSSFTTLTTLQPAASIVANTNGTPALLPLSLLRGIYSAGENVAISPDGVISASSSPVVSLGAVQVGTGLTVGASGSLAVSYGTAAGTAAAGNDSRIAGAEQTANKGQANGYAGLDSNGRVAIAQLNGADVSATVVTALVSGTIARSLATRFADVINVNDFGLARDGVTDDSARFITAVQAAVARAGCLYIPTGGPILLTDAAQQNIANVAIIGDGLRDIGASGGYGHTGSQLWFTGVTKSPFLLGGGVRFEGINFFWPNQTESATANNGNAPIVYPPLFGQQNPAAQVNRFDFINCQVTNCYDFLTDTGTAGNTVLGAVSISRCEIYAIRNCLTLQYVPEVMFLTDTLFSWGVFQNVVNAGPTYNLRTFTNTQGCWLKVIGDGTPTSFPSTQVEGVMANNCYVFGSAKGIWCAAGALGLSDLINTSFDTTPVVLQVDPGGSTETLRFSGGAWYPITEGGGVSSTAIVITNPAPGSPGLNLSLSGIDIPFIDGSLGAISGTNIYRLSFNDLRCPAFGHTANGAGPYYGLQLNAPNAFLRVTSCDIGGQNSGITNVGLQINGIAAATITDNTFYGLTAAVDIETTGGQVTLTGNTSLATQGSYSLSGTGGSNIFDNGNNWDKGNFAYRGIAPNLYRAGATIGVQPVAGSPSSPYVGLAPSGGGDVRMGMTALGNGVLSLTTNYFNEEVVRINRVAGAVAGVGINGAASGGTPTLFGFGSAASVGLQVTGQGGGTLTLGSGGATGSPVVLAGARAEPSYVTYAPVSGFSQTIANNVREIVLTPSSTLSSGTLTMPTAPLDGQSLVVATTQAINALTVAANSGQTINAGNAIALAANSSASWRWIAGMSTWIRE